MTPFSYSRLTSFLLLFAIPALSFAQKKLAEEDLRKLMVKYESIGLNVAVVKGDRIIYQHAFGLKNKETGTELKINDLFRIASISKSFSATSIMQLVEAGKISLDDDFSKLIGFKVRNPKFPETVITLRMVMSHTSSINDGQGYFNLDILNPDKNPDYAKSYDAHEPGKGYAYCNLNYNMIGAVIEKLSAENFEPYIQSHILKPLGLHGGYQVAKLDQNLLTTLYAYDTVTHQFAASTDAYLPRTEELNKYKPGYSTPVLSPTGGMKLSAPDLAKYMMMHAQKGIYKGKRIMKTESAETMQSVMPYTDHYGLAIMTRDDVIPGKVMKGHTGSAYGLYSIMMFQPEEQFGIVAITNGCNVDEYSGLNPFMQEVVYSLYRNLLEKQ